MGRYWNGYRWVETAEPKTLDEHFDMSEVKETLLEVELNPRTRTREEAPMVSFEVEVEPGVPEQPTPNLAPVDFLGQPIVEGKPHCQLAVPRPTDLLDKSVDVFSRNPVHRPDPELPVVARATTRDRQEITGRLEIIPLDDKVVVDVPDVGPPCTFKQIDNIDDFKAEFGGPDKDATFSDETRARIRRELGMDDEGSH